MPFNVEEIPDLTGKVAIVTGASIGGLGFESSCQLAAKGCHVFLACRSKEKGEKAVEEVKKVATGPEPELLIVDLGDLETIKPCVDEFLARDLPLHILMANAGIMHCPFQKSKQGHELQFAVNHLGHFKFVNLLVPKLKESQPSRIVILSSSLHKDCPKEGIKFDDLNWGDGKTYDFKGSYGHSKMANIMFCYELAERLKDTQVRTNVVHPGFVDTELTRHRESNIFLKLIVKLIKWRSALNIHDGALTQLYAAASPDIETQDIRAQFYIPIAEKADLTFRPPDFDVQIKRLWAISEDLVGEKF